MASGKGRARVRLEDVPSIRQFEELVKALKRQALRSPVIDYVLPLTLCLTGARISEALRLTTVDVDYDRNLIYIPCEKKRGERRKRAVDVPGWFLGILSSYVTYNAIGFELFPISRCHAWRIVKQVTGYRPHALRHAHGMYLLWKGYSVEEVRRRLGHESWTMVKYYVEVVGIDVKRRNPFEDLF